MKRQAFVILTTLSLLVVLTATSVPAQSDLRLKVNIPFEFSVRGKILPAGEYAVRYKAQGFLVIKSVDGRVSQNFRTLFTLSGTRQDQSSLVFNRYGDQYFLSTIWTAGQYNGFQLRKPDAEQKLIETIRSSGKSGLERQTVSIVPHR